MVLIVLCWNVLFAGNIISAYWPYNLQLCLYRGCRKADTNIIESFKWPTVAKIFLKKKTCALADSSELWVSCQCRHLTSSLSFLFCPCLISLTRIYDAEYRGGSRHPCLEWKLANLEGKGFQSFTTESDVICIFHIWLLTYSTSSIQTLVFWVIFNLETMLNFTKSSFSSN